MPFAKANEISIYYEMHGETGSPLVMIAGLGATIMTWTPELIARLCAAHRVIIFDNRGAGQTEAPGGPYAMAQFAADTAGLLDALGIPRAHVLGVSMGGMIAQQVAIRCPVLIQAGSEDILIPPENARILARLIPNARLVEYAGAGHNYWVQEPQAAEDIAAFLEAVDAAQIARRRCL